MLTDTPVVAELKREFRRLDAREEALKYQQPWSQAQRDELIGIRARKNQISVEIFNQ